MHLCWRLLLRTVAASLFTCTAGFAQTVVFQQAGFPTIDSQPLSPTTLQAAVGGKVVFADLQQLTSGAVLKDASLLVLPYGSAFPVEAFPSIMKFVGGGGNLLVIGGQPLHVPVRGAQDGAFTPEPPQTSYSRALDLRHSYAVPLETASMQFHWRNGYDFLPMANVQVKQVFAQEGRVLGLGYLDTADGMHVASPIIVSDRGNSRFVALPIQPMPGYWESKDGIAFLHTAAQYAQAGSNGLMIETQYSALRPGEMPQITAHLHHPRGVEGNVRVQLLQGATVLKEVTIPAAANEHTLAVPLRDPLQTGVYTLHATWTPAGASEPLEFAENGIEVEELASLESGDALRVKGDFIQLGAKPFFPVGVNYFSTEANGWDFSGPRNAAVWERDFADMERNGVNFVRTGVWMGGAKFVEPLTGAANERFLRNVEAFLSAAHRHHIAVNFTLFAFTPRVFDQQRRSDGSAPPPPNPYLDRGALDTEKGYVSSVVERFRKLPWLSYDLINEPSFSNPGNIFHGNVPNNDPAEVAAWHGWLEKHYGTIDALASAWRTTAGQLKEFNSIPLPQVSDLTYDRYGNPAQIRAYDYNLFAQEMFAGWVRQMVGTVRDAGSQQLVNVGQDEGGVDTRVLNQFYATAGVAFTTNHTYWHDDALLWDSVAAKRPGMPNITGETGYQPAWDPDGTWRYDELTGTAIEERKLAMGFAAGSSGALQWDWDREVDFGMLRSDGSSKTWVPMMRDLGAFATKASALATSMTLPEIALVLPQSLQLSVHNSQAVEAQQNAVRTLYHYNRVEAYAVGEYQTDTLGSPKLMILPSPYGLSTKAWADIEARVRAGAVLLVTGPFSADEHMHANDRSAKIGIAASVVPLQLRDQVIHTPAGALPLRYTGNSTTVLDRAALSDGKDFAEVTLGKGKVIFITFPIELNSDPRSVAAVYTYAIKTAGISKTYTTPVENPGILICPTRLAGGTLYVLTSETETQPVTFTDVRSGKTFSGKLEAGRAAMLMVGAHGELVSSYNWHPGK